MSDKINLLITGGAGFIGSHLVECFLKDQRVAKVRILDDLSNGYFSNIERFMAHPKFEFIEGDITNYQTCLEACEGIQKISHQAALGSVPRSIENPMRSTEVNVLGTVNLLHAAHVKGVERVILACSSSTYGDHPALPKLEDRIGKPLSPYAVTKFSVEQFADVFGKTYDLRWIGLRYFNIFGPNQNPDSPYAAVIPLFSEAFVSNGKIIINGDGETTRDFTYVDNAVSINDLALFTENKEAFDQIYNVACGDQVTLNEIVSLLAKNSGADPEIEYGPERKGDVRHSKADISKAQNLLSYQPKVRFKEGLEKVYKYYSENSRRGK